MVARNQGPRLYHLVTESHAPERPGRGRGITHMGSRMHESKPPIVHPPQPGNASEGITQMAHG